MANPMLYRAAPVRSGLSPVFALRDDDNSLLPFEACAPRAPKQRAPCIPPSSLWRDRAHSRDSEFSTSPLSSLKSGQLAVYGHTSASGSLSSTLGGAGRSRIDMAKPVPKQPPTTSAAVLQSKHYGWRARKQSNFSLKNWKALGLSSSVGVWKPQINPEVRWQIKD